MARSAKGRLVLAAVVALIAVAGYFFGTREVENPVTGETQRIALTQDQEIALGLQAAPQMAAEFGGLHPDAESQRRVDAVGARLVERTEAAATGYPFEFHVLADEATVNAFALPGGQVFLTAGLARLLSTEGELAGVLGHEIGHVVGRHSAERLAKAQLIEGLTGAAVIATYDAENPSSQQQAQMAALVGQMINMKHSRSDEHQSDELGVRFLAGAGYDPRALVRVMEVLASAGGGAGPPEFMSTHPDPGNRREQIEQEIAEVFPDGVPEGLIP